MTNMGAGLLKYLHETICLTEEKVLIVHCLTGRTILRFELLRSIYRILQDHFPMSKGSMTGAKILSAVQN